MAKHYLNGDEMWRAWQYRKHGLSFEHIAKRMGFGSSHGQIWRVVTDLDHRLAGGHVDRKKNRPAFNTAFVRIKATGIVPMSEIYPAKPPETPAVSAPVQQPLIEVVPGGVPPTYVKFELVDMNGRKYFSVPRKQFVIITTDTHNVIFTQI